MLTPDNSTHLLARISFDGRNFQDAYDKYSKIVESDINNVDAWLMKALSAGYLSNRNKCTIEESQICLDYAKKLGLSNEQKKLISTNILFISKNYISELISKAKGVASDMGKQPTTTFELSAVKSVRNTADRYESNNEIFDNVLKAVIFSRKTDEFDGGIVCNKEQVNIIDKFLSEINNELHEGKKKNLYAIRQEIVNEISTKDSSYSIPNAPKSGGCFIATSIYEDYDHKNVLILRKFRDEKLLRNEFGVYLVKIYYRLSPRLVSYSRDKKYLKNFVKLFLVKPIVWVAKRYNT